MIVYPASEVPQGSAEEWRAIDAFYSVSNLGRVRRDARGHGTRPGRILAPRRTKQYLTVGLGGERYQYRYIHRLVAHAFLGPCPLGKEVNHKNGIPTDNRLSNLEYVTRAENCEHARRLGLTKPPPIGIGESNGRAKLTEDEARAIRRRSANGESAHSLAREFGIGFTTVGHLIAGRTWRCAL